MTRLPLLVVLVLTPLLTSGQLHGYEGASNDTFTLAATGASSMVGGGNDTFKFTNQPFGGAGADSYVSLLGGSSRHWIW